jgi:nucleotide-binding universal stress UspA family protein
VNEIVVGVNESDTAYRAAQAAARLASEADAELHVVMCVDRSTKVLHVSGETWHIDSVAEAEQYVASLAGELAPPKVSHTISFDDPVKALCSAAEKLDARMIVVGNRRVQGAGRVLGSVALDVLRKAPCDVLVANTTS